MYTACISILLLLFEKLIFLVQRHPFLNPLNRNARQHGGQHSLADGHTFQRDTSNCLGYLGEVVSIFKGLLLTDNRVIKPDELLHFARSVVLVVGIKIYPYAADIYEMVLPYLQTSSCLMAVELLSALIFSLKREFAQYGNDTFELVLKLLREHDRRDFNTIVFLLLTITLLTALGWGTWQKRKAQQKQRQAIRPDAIFRFKQILLHA